MAGNVLPKQENMTENQDERRKSVIGKLKKASVLALATGMGKQLLGKVSPPSYIWTCTLSYNDFTSICMLRAAAFRWNMHCFCDSAYDCVHLRRAMCFQATAKASQKIEPLPHRLKLKTFILKHWKSSFLHSSGHLPACYHSRKGIHARYLSLSCAILQGSVNLFSYIQSWFSCVCRYCNGLFIHYKTKEGVLHGEFKQTYLITIEALLKLIKELAGTKPVSVPCLIFLDNKASAEDWHCWSIAFNSHRDARRSTGSESDTRVWREPIVSSGLPQVDPGT